MFWKKWPYWLRGGVIGAGITLILIAIMSVLSLLNLDDSLIVLTIIGPTILIPGLILSSILDTMLPLVSLSRFIAQISNYNDFLQFIIIGIIASAFWFFSGSLIGALVGYIKSRKKNSV